jgi:hypothetical protein
MGVSISGIRNRLPDLPFFNEAFPIPREILSLTEIVVIIRVRSFSFSQDGGVL